MLRGDLKEAGRSQIMKHLLDYGKVLENIYRVMRVHGGGVSRGIR